MSKYISFSQLKNWTKCPFYHKLVSIDKVEGFTGNIYTAFGTAIHNLIEKRLLNEISEEVQFETFKKNFSDEIEALKEEVKPSQKDIDTFTKQSSGIIENYYDHLISYFGSDFDIISCEEQIYEKINDFTLDNYMFKGYIDLVVKVGETYHILDWKTCSWGWDAKRRSDTNTTYQLVLYKYYYALKHDIDPKNIKCHFGLLKRTAKKDHVEIFEITTGPRRTKNAIELLTKALHNIHKKNYMKNRLSCDRCEFKGTKWCP